MQILKLAHTLVYINTVCPQRMKEWSISRQSDEFCLVAEIAKGGSVTNGLPHLFYLFIQLLGFFLACSCKKHTTSKKLDVFLT